MIKQLFTKQSSTITGAAILLAGASFVSRLLGVLRDRALSHTFGAGPELDAYFTAFRIPDLVYNLIIAGALSAGFIPLFTKLYQKNKQDAWAFTNNVFSTLLAAVVTISTVLIFYAEPLSALIAPGFTADQQLLVASLSKILFWSPIILGISAIVSGVLQSLKYFLVYALSPIMYNVGIIVGALWFSQYWGITGVAYGVVLGATLHLLVQVPTLYHSGFSLAARLKWTPNLKKLLRMMVPRTASLLIYQGVILALTIMATSLTVGSVAVFNFANNIQFFPIGIVGISFALAAFPTLCQSGALGNMTDYISTITGTVRKILLIIVPVTVLFLLLRAEIVRIVLGSGAFDWAATVRTADSLAFFAVGLFAQALLPLLSRGFWALHDSTTPFVASLIGGAATITIARATVPLFEQLGPGSGVLALAASFALGGIISAILLWVWLHNRVGALKERVIIVSLMKMSVAGVIMAFVVQISKEFIGNLVNMQTFVGVLLKLGAASLIGFTVYTGLMLWLKSSEMKELLDGAKRRYLKWKNVQEAETLEHLS